MKRTTTIIFIILLMLIGINNVYGINDKIGDNLNVKFFKTILTEINTFSTIEITAEEYENANEIMLLNTSKVTEYKKLEIYNANNIIFLNLEWKKTPLYKSFDVIALRGEGITFDLDTIEGKQNYKTNNSNQSIGYTNTSANTKLFPNGFGISMNLVDNSTYHNLTISASYYKTSSNAKVYGSYQHAQANLSLSQSKMYTLDSSGYGKTIKFDNSVKSYYDAMDGVEISV